MLTPFALNENCGTLLFEDEAAAQRHDRCVDSNASNYGTFVGLGMATLVVGSTVGWLLWPDRKDMMKMVNEHNWVRPKHPIEFQIGFNPSPRYAQATLIWRL